MTAVLDDRLGSLLGDAERALVHWLPKQRWFGGNGRTVHRVRLRLVGRFTDQPAYGGPAGLFTVAEVEIGDDVWHYSLPLGLAAAGDLPAAVDPIAAVGGLALYDGVADHRLTTALLGLIGTGSVRDGVRFVAEPRGGLAFLPDTELSSRVNGAEQSNTSVVLGERFILKLFRRVSAGINPDLELHRALGAAGSHDIAPLLGAIEGRVDGSPVTFGMLHSYCDDADDGWKIATDDVGSLLAHGRTAGGFPDEARRLGRAVATVHSGLAAELGIAVLGTAQLAELSRGMLSRLDDVLCTVPELEPYQNELAAVFAAVAELSPGVVVQRVHGDLHLGQALRSSDRWLLIDFEGEPSATVAERRALHSPLKDVAGMLRSFDYAAHHQLVLEGRGDPVAEVLVTDWAARAREAFCDGYVDGSGVDPRDQAALLLAYELEKAVYEVRYELRNRPGWLPVPLRAVGRLLG